MSGVPKGVCPLCGGAGRDYWQGETFTVERCRCGMLFKRPAGDAQDVAESVYGGDGVVGRGHHRRRLERAAARNLALFGPVTPGARLLEIGIGGGELLHAAARLGFQATGVELSEANAQAARTTYGATVHCGPLSALDAVQGFDYVVMSHVIEHLEDPIGLLREVRVRMAAGARILILAPNFEGLLARALRAQWSNVAMVDHVALFGPDTLARAVRAAGLEVEALWTREGDTDAIGALLWKWAPSRQRHRPLAAGGAASTRRWTAGRLVRQAPYLLGRVTAPLTWPVRAALGAGKLGAELCCVATRS